VELNFKLAEKYQDRYENDKTTPYFEKVLELDPNDEKGHKVEATYQIALFQARNKQNIDPLKAFIATNPEEKYLVNSYGTLASIYSRKRDTKNTVATYEEALKKLPDNARLMYSYSSTIFRGKMEDLYKKGLKLNEKVKTLDPDREVSTIYNLVNYYTNIEDKEKIIETFENAIGKFPDNARLKSSYASSINSMKITSKYDKGIEIMENALAADPDAVYMNYTLGLLYQNNGELKKAIEAVKKVVDKYPKRKVYANTLAKIEKELEESK
jgi:tetratricopeptide (TPR) repeat protein